MPGDTRSDLESRSAEDDAGCGMTRDTPSTGVRSSVPAGRRDDDSGIHTAAHSGVNPAAAPEQPTTAGTGDPGRDSGAAGSVAITDSDLERGAVMSRGERRDATSQAEITSSLSVSRTIFVTVLLVGFVLSGLFSACYAGASLFASLRRCAASPGGEEPPSEGGFEEGEAPESAGGPSASSGSCVRSCADLKAAHAVTAGCGVCLLCTGAVWRCAENDCFRSDSAGLGSSESGGREISKRTLSWFDDTMVHREAPAEWLTGINYSSLPKTASGEDPTPATLFRAYKKFMETEVQPKRDADPHLTSIVLLVLFHSLTDEKMGGFFILPAITNTRDHPMEVTMTRADATGQASTVCEDVELTVTENREPPGVLRREWQEEDGFRHRCHFQASREDRTNERTNDERRIAHT